MSFFRTKCFFKENQCVSKGNPFFFDRKIKYSSLTVVKKSLEYFFGVYRQVEAWLITSSNTQLSSDISV